MANYNPSLGSPLDLLRIESAGLTPNQDQQLTSSYPGIMNDIDQILNTLHRDWVEDASSYDVVGVLERFRQAVRSLTDWTI